MDLILRSSTAGDPSLTNQPLLNVVLAYEDYATGIDAVRTLGRIAERAGQPHEFGTEHVWTFQTLSTPALRSMAADDAAKADVVIVAAHNSGHLPGAVKQWLDLWLDHRGMGPVALVALLDDNQTNDPKPASIESYLKRCARRSGMDFFVRKLRDLQGSDEESAALMAEHSEQTEEALEQIMHRPRHGQAEAATERMACAGE